MRKYRWGILAPGNIAQKFTKGLDAIPGAAIKHAVGSRDLKRAEEFAGRHGYEKAYGSYQELAEDPLVDIIYVATPHTQHEEAAALCLSRGKAALCEKPMAVNALQAGRMARLARENGAFLMEAMWTRFLPAVLKAQDLIAAGAIGDVRFVQADFGFRAELDPGSRLFSPALGGGSLLDVGVYNLHLCSMVFGRQPVRVQSHMAIGSTGVDEEASALLSYEGGQSALLYSSVRLDTPNAALVVGGRGRIELPEYFWRGTELRLHGEGGVQGYSLPYGSTGYQFEALEAMRCLDAGLLESPSMPLDESVAILETADRIREDNGLRYPCDEG